MKNIAHDTRRRPAASGGDRPPKADKPQRFEERPEALRPLEKKANWVAWRWELITGKDGRSKWTKVPYNPRTGGLAKVNGPMTWGTYEQAIDAAPADETGGIGFMLADSGIAAIDLDKCRDPKTGKIDAWAKVLIEQAGTYCELTPSGTGGRLIGRADGLKVHRNKKDKTTGAGWEVYRDCARYITMTGRHLNQSSPDKLTNGINAVIDRLVAGLDEPTQERESQPEHSAPRGEGDLLTLLTVPFRHMLKMGQFDKYPSRSEACAALIVHMHARGLSKPEMLALFDGSPLRERYSTDSLAKEIDRVIAKFGKASPADRPRKQMTTFTAATLREKKFEPLAWAVDGLIPEGLSLLVGKPKLGKSWMCLSIAIAVATGGRAFGEFACKSGDVRYLALEDGERRLQHRMKKLKASWPERLTFSLDCPGADDGGLEQVRRWLADRKWARLVIIDVLARFRSRRGDKGEQLYDRDYKSGEGLQALAREFGVAIVVVHHTRKLAGEDPWMKSQAPPA
jgi:hypothetical protein